MRNFWLPFEWSGWAGGGYGSKGWAGGGYGSKWRLKEGATRNNKTKLNSSRKAGEIKLNTSRNISTDCSIVLLKRLWKYSSIIMLTYFCQYTSYVYFENACWV